MKFLVDDALANGAYTCLPKPLNIETTLLMIDEVLQKKRKNKVELKM